MAKDTAADQDEKDVAQSKPWEGKSAADAKIKAKAKMKKDDGDEDEEEDDDEEAEKSAAKKSADFRADLSKAIKILSRHNADHDPSLRREALLAKELRGGGLNKSERQELIAHLDDGPPADGLGDAALRQAGGAKIEKAQAMSDGFRESHDNFAKSLTLFADHLDKSLRQQEATQYLMARTLTAVGEAVDGTLSELSDRQAALEGAVDKYGRQPAGAPRSVGLGYAEKSFAGGGAGGREGDRIEKSSRNQLQKALRTMADAEPQTSGMRQAYEMALLGLRINRPLMPAVREKLEAHLAGEPG